MNRKCPLSNRFHITPLFAQLLLNAFVRRSVSFLSADFTKEHYTHGFRKHKSYPVYVYNLAMLKIRYVMCKIDNGYCQHPGADECYFTAFLALNKWHKSYFYRFYAKQVMACITIVLLVISPENTFRQISWVKIVMTD